MQPSPPSSPRVPTRPWRTCVVLQNLLTTDYWKPRYTRALAVLRKLDDEGLHALVQVAEDRTSPSRLSAIDALGYVMDARALPRLVLLLHDTSVTVREASAAALGRIGHPAAYLPLLVALEDDANGGRISFEAAEALGAIKEPRSVEPLIALTGHPHSRVRLNAIRALTTIGDRRAVSTVIARLKDSSRNVRLQAAESLSLWQESRSVEALVEALQDSDLYVRLYAALALGSLRNPEAIPALRMLAEMADSVIEIPEGLVSLRKTALWAMSECQTDAIPDHLPSDS